MVKGIGAGIGLTLQIFMSKILSFKFIFWEITSDTWKWMRCKTKLKKISYMLQKLNVTQSARTNKWNKIYLDVLKKPFIFCTCTNSWVKSARFYGESFFEFKTIIFRKKI